MKRVGAMRESGNRMSGRKMYAPDSRASRRASGRKLGPLSSPERRRVPCSVACFSISLRASEGPSRRARTHDNRRARSDDPRVVAAPSFYPPGGAEPLKWPWDRDRAPSQ